MERVAQDGAKGLEERMEAPHNTKFDPNEGWVLEYDRKTGHFYYFNTMTGDSRWAEEAVGEEELAAYGKAAVSIAATDSIKQMDEARAATIVDSEGGQPQQVEMTRLKRRAKERDGPTPYGDGVDDMEEDGIEGDRTIMLDASRHGAEVYRKTQAVVMAFTAMFYFHGCCCEGPMAVIEGVVRAPGLRSFLVDLINYWKPPVSRRRGGALFHFLRSILLRDGSSLRTALLWLREGVLMICAVVTLVVPGLSLCVYRKFDADADEWELSSIPTFAGKVDPRRFFTFSHGQGSMASNAFYDSDTGSMDTLGNQILHPPKSLIMTRHLDSQADGGGGGDDGDDGDGDSVVGHDDDDGQLQEDGGAGASAVAGGGRATAATGGGGALEVRVKLSDQNRAYHQIEGGSRRL